MKRAIIALTLLTSIAGATGSAFAAGDNNGNGNGNGNGDNHNVCIVFAQDQRYTNTTYYCISTPDVPPVG